MNFSDDPRKPKDTEASVVSMDGYYAIYNRILVL